MRPATWLIAALFVVLVLVAAGVKAGPDESIQKCAEIRSAVTRGLEVVVKAAQRYPQNQSCFSCHHQTLPMLAAVAGQKAGIEVDDQFLPAQRQFTHASFHDDLDDLRQGKGIGGRAMTVGYGLWALRLSGHQPDETTEAMMTYLLKTQHEDGHWSRQTSRPPLEDSNLTCTTVAVYGLQKFAAEQHKKEVEAAIARAKEWLFGATLQSQEDRCSRLWATHLLGGTSDELAAARQTVLSAQRDDGGWAQLDDMPADAYATGQTLYVLHLTGFDTSDRIYQRGVAFLLASQCDDGSWFVRTRSKPVQPYFDNGDPHGNDQFISTSATCWATAALAATLEAPATAGNATASLPMDRGGHGRVHNIKVLSNQIDDMTTAENVLRSFVKPAMNQAERAEALWRATVKYRHQTVPPNEFLAADWEAHDPIKLFNVYGYCMCCCSSAVIEALNRLDGRETRGRILNGHSVPEVRFDDGWHMYDASLITYFPKPEGGLPASVDEISQAVSDWYADHPGYQRQPQKLLEVMRQDGWTGWKSQGPTLLANCPFYRLGYFPARTHGWDATMQEYDRKCEVYEYGYQIGHRSLLSLRPGESFVREAGNRGWHVNMKQSPNWDGLRAKATDSDMEYLRDFFPPYRGGLVGNGLHRYQPDLASGGLAAGADVYENLAVDRAAATGTSRPIVHLADGGKPGVVVIPLSSPYVYLGGRLSLKAFRQTDAEAVSVSLSTNNGRSFHDIWSADGTGWSTADIDLSPNILRRYSYLLKIELRSDSPTTAGLAELAVENRFQHAPRSLPFLAKGENTITVSTDGDPAIATRTVTCRLAAEPGFSENETSETMGLTFENLNRAHGGCWWQGGTGAFTVPVETPGELVGLRFGGHFRARDARDLVRISVSFDDGRTWQESARIAGPTQGRTEYFRHDKIPADATGAQLRYEMTGINTAGVLSFRVDADYRDPAAAVGLRPFEVVHRWREEGQEKERRTVVNRLPYEYQVTAIAEPETQSVEYRMPADK